MKARSHSADRVSTCALLLGGAVGAVLVFVVALPLASSNPFPTLREAEWIIDDPPFDAQLMAASPIARPHGEPADPPLVMASLVDSGDPSVTFAQRWNLRVPQAAIPAAVSREEPPAVAPNKTLEAPRAAGEPSAPMPRPAPPARAAVTHAPKRRPVDIQAPVDRYLWEVYQRKPVKSDSTGDFTWKDEAAAKRLGMSLKSYVIGGMDPDFREQLYHAGRAMDAHGLKWSMLSAFRDDYRQKLAAGFKARSGNSLHGGSRATGGYGHGQAIDITVADGEAETVWHWIDAHGAKFGLRRPMPRIDPAHIQAKSSFHDLAHELREARLKLDNKLAAARTDPAARTKLAAHTADASEGRSSRR
jgi:hypothetical protein